MIDLQKLYYHVINLIDLYLFFEVITYIENMSSGMIHGLIPNIQKKTSVNFSSDNSYIFDITSNNSFCVVSGSNHEFKSYNYNNNSLTFCEKLSYHNDIITNLKIH